MPKCLSFDSCRHKPTQHYLSSISCCCRYRQRRVPLIIDVIVRQSYAHIEYWIQRYERFRIYKYYLLTYLLTPWSRVLLEKLTSFQLVKKFPAFYGTRRLIIAFTIPHHLFLSWACSIQSMPPHPVSWRFILVLSSRLRLGLPSGLFPTGFPTIILYTPLLSPIHATCPAHLILLDFIARK